MTDRDIHCERTVRLRPGVYQATRADGVVTLFTTRPGGASERGERLGVLSPAERDTLRAVARNDMSAVELDTMAGVESTLPARLLQGGWLIIHYGLNSRPVITVRPLGPHRAPQPPAPVAPVLSRFALLRRDGGTLVLESPLSRAAIDVHDAAALALIHRLSGPATSAAQSGSVAVLGAANLPAEVVTVVIAVLAWYGFVHEAAEDQGEDFATAQWSQHELWFHSRSRGGYHDHPYGATGWAAGRFATPTPRREPWPGPRIALPVPAVGSLGRPFGDVLAARRSIRAPCGDRPLTLAQLGEFLHASARVRGSRPAGGDDRAMQGEAPVATGTVVADDATGVPADPPDVSWRPSPSGGARHSLEIYLAVTAVAGLPAALYHYDPYDHALEPVPADAETVRELTEGAAVAAGGSTRPQVLLVFSARFGRTMGKYQGMAYSLILKDAGALMQTMYLVATAMGLAPCALGSGDAELFARATGLHPLVEASVGEFMLSAGTVTAHRQSAEEIPGDGPAASWRVPANNDSPPRLA